MSAGAIVLAAGAGRRFGGAKQIALWRGRPLLAWALDAALGAAALRPVVVVLGAHAAAVREVVDLSDVLVAEAQGLPALARRRVEQGQLPRPGWRQGQTVGRQQRQAR